MEGGVADHVWSIEEIRSLSDQGLLDAIRARQSEARWRKDVKASGAWEVVEFASIDALVADNHGEFL
jgi:hypothetical protein